MTEDGELTMLTGFSLILFVSVFSSFTFILKVICKGISQNL